MSRVKLKVVAPLPDLRHECELVYDSLSIRSASALFIAQDVTLALSKMIEVTIGMRALQAAGSCNAMTISAATLADIYDTHEQARLDDTVNMFTFGPSSS
ncbi:uncharacterized protein F5147DRAFT_821282 [Suillus discolor]|uniref:Uncharacterized protein n=1 Tax=Suillus discolor TaxID=1912936 RepID=A0A9P7JNP7_9AGAM|nr:uncharacterized protein F5147DRAFT_821282 [Suillus discolor]KAG2093344.1 hypothetical protein F5147DRAFT_821282 [Suillus discolor]